MSRTTAEPRRTAVVVPDPGPDPLEEIRRARQALAAVARVRAQLAETERSLESFVARASAATVAEARAAPGGADATGGPPVGALHTGRASGPTGGAVASGHRTC